MIIIYIFFHLFCLFLDSKFVFIVLLVIHIRFSFSFLSSPPEQAVGLYKVISKPEIVKEVPREMGSYYEKDEGSVDEGVQLFDIERIHFPHEFDRLEETMFSVLFWSCLFWELMWRLLKYFYSTDVKW